MSEWEHRPYNGRACRSIQNEDGACTQYYLIKHYGNKISYCYTDEETYKVYEAVREYSEKDLASAMDEFKTYYVRAQPKVETDWFAKLSGIPSEVPGPPVKTYADYFGNKPGLGEKKDAGKLPWTLLPFAALREITKVLQFGGVKYAPYNWAKGMGYHKLGRAVLEHFASWFEGERNDPETGHHHLAHCACCILFLLYYELHYDKYKEFDDRPKQ